LSYERYTRTRKAEATGDLASKPVEERLRLTLTMNDDLYGFWNAAKKNKAKSDPNQLSDK